MVIFIILAFLALIPTNIIAAEESITLTTYYPSPYGVYSEMRLYPKDNPTIPCQEGLMYYDQSEHNMKVCGGTPSDWIPVGGSFWTLTAPDLYPNDPAWNVGIGTAIPEYKLHISDPAPVLMIEDSDAAADAKKWIIAGSTANTLRFQAVTDAGVGGGNLIDITRSGNQISGMDFLQAGSLKNRISTSGDSYFTSGNVGIGTMNPAFKLDVSSSTGAAGSIPLRLKSTAPETGTMLFQIGAQANTENTIVSLDLSETASKNFTIAGWNLGNVAMIKLLGSTTYMSGNVGIAKTSPQSPAPNGNSGNLDVNDIYLRSTGQWLSQSGGGGPGSWTCTIRTTSTLFNCVSGCTATASCQSSEKVIAGGCSFSYSSAYFTSRNSPASGGQGWTCAVSGASGTLTAYADCCS